MQIQVEEVTRADVLALLREHLADMYRQSPPGSVYALDVSGLQVPAVTFWTVRRDGQLMGCGALKELTPQTAEIKSMRTATAYRRQGVARALLSHLLTVARARGYRSVSLETGSTAPFWPAIALYEDFGFSPCVPFAGYADTAFNRFMSLNL